MRLVRIYINGFNKTLRRYRTVVSVHHLSISRMEQEQTGNLPFLF